MRVRSEDLRLSCTFLPGGERVRLILFGKVFNLLKPLTSSGTAPGNHPHRDHLVGPCRLMAEIVEAE